MATDRQRQAARGDYRARQRDKRAAKRGKLYAGIEALLPMVKHPYSSDRERWGASDAIGKLAKRMARLRW